jgi:arsenate reductase (thioredoxin)
MSDKTYNVLFLCTGNSARSIMAESILRKDGQRRFRSFSAGSQPKGRINPFALKVLESLNYPTDAMRSKSWNEFATPKAPVMDFVFTVCDSAAGESCPVWPGQPMSAHWGIEDPAAVEGSDIEKEAAFVAAFRYLKNRIGVFTNLPLRSIDKLSLGTKRGDDWRTAQYPFFASCHFGARRPAPKHSRRPDHHLPLRRGGCEVGDRISCERLLRRSSRALQPLRGGRECCLLRPISQ